MNESLSLKDVLTNFTWLVGNWHDIDGVHMAFQWKDGLSGNVYLKVFCIRAKVKERIRVFCSTGWMDDG
jgi:hypothetical protein